MICSDNSNAELDEVTSLAKVILSVLRQIDGQKK